MFNEVNRAVMDPQIEFPLDVGLLSVYYPASMKSIKNRYLV